MQRRQRGIWLATMSMTLVVGGLWAADGVDCPFTITQAGVVWTAIGSGWTNTTCWIGPFYQECKTYTLNRYMSEEGQERDWNCSLKRWA